MGMPRLMLDGWGGRSEHPVEIVGETPKKYRVRLLGYVRLPGGREGKKGDVVLVPKHAVKKERTHVQSPDWPN